MSKTSVSTLITYCRHLSITCGRM